MISTKFTFNPSGWFLFATFGEHPIQIASDQGGTEEHIQVVDETSVDSLVSSLRAEKATVEANGETWAGLLINQDHRFWRNGGTDTEALGWIMDARKGVEGLWVKPRWTTLGEEKLAGGMLRFPSLEFDRETAVTLGPKRWRPMRFVGAALTNKPNLKGLPPLCNSRVEEKQKPSKAAGRTKMNELKLIAAALGLGDEATADEIIAQIKGIVESIAKLNEEKVSKEADDFVAANSEKIGDKAVIIAAYKKDPELTKVMLNAIAVPKAKALPVALNSAAKTPDAVIGSQGSYKAPDGSTHSNMVVYCNSLTGRAKTTFLKQNMAALLQAANG